jgi:hypothetical protein
LTPRSKELPVTDEPKSNATYSQARWLEHFNEIDKEIALQASLCKVRLLDPGVIKRVLQKDKSVCGADNPRSFEKLRSLLMMHYSVRDKAVVAIGEKETLAILGDIVERLRTRYGDSLGSGHGGPTG